MSSFLLVCAPTGAEAAPTADQPLIATVRQGGKDGTLAEGAAGSKWYEHGVVQTTNFIGRREGRLHRMVLKLDLPEVKPGHRFVFARIVLPAADADGAGAPSGLRIRGIAADGVGTVRANVLDGVAWTEAAVSWPLEMQWPGQPRKRRSRCMAVRRYSPDVAPIINELIGRSGWGRTANGKTIALVIEPLTDADSVTDRYVAVEDVSSRTGSCRSDQSTSLELYPTVRSTFLGRELLGRVSDREVTVNLYSLIATEVAFAFGSHPEQLTRRTAIGTYEGGQPIEVVLEGLEPNQRYYYRTLYRSAGTTEFESGPVRKFHTQRPRGTPFVFAVQSDPHLQGMLRTADRTGLKLYRRSMDNVVGAEPDFLLDLGDTFHTQFFAGRDARDASEALHRHLDHRPFFDRAGHSVPVFLVIGNHEGEQGWRLDGTADNLAIWATVARKQLYPNPIPDAFFDAPRKALPIVGHRESIYSFEWGDALLVAIDPFWFTPKNPHQQNPRRPDPWAWTLGEEQYRWLRETLESSDARFKLVFAHHVTGGLEPHNPYGRGGARGARHALGEQGSFEWGGENADGSWGFDEHRPGWGKPVHQVLVDTNVAVFFHGHDHCYAYEEVDHVVYQGLPAAADSSRGKGFCNRAHLYAGATVRNNSGHLRVSVGTRGIRVDYVRTILNDPERSEEIAHSYEIPDCNGNGIVDDREVLASSTPPGGGTSTIPCRPEP